MQRHQHNNLEEFTIDDEDIGDHDQLPSVEEAKLNSARTNAQTTTSRCSSSRSRRKIGVILAVVAAVIFILGLSVGLLRKGNRDRPSRLSQVISFLQINQLSNAADLAQENSPQRRAAEFIADEDPEEIAITASTTFMQRYTLAVLFYAFHGESWPPGLGWLSDTPECEWHNNDQYGGYYGTKCNDAGDVSELDLCT